MKIYNATLYRNNYGSALQAFALQKKLEELGADTAIIERAPFRHKKTPGYLLRRLFTPERHYGPIRKIRRYLQRRKLAVKYRRIMDFVEKHIRIEPYHQAVAHIQREETLLLVGSDQVWNTVNGPIDRRFLFDDAPAGTKKYSFAASLGRGALKKKEIARYCEALKDFQVVSLREQEAFDCLAGPLNQIAVRRDVDPTLLYPKSFWKHYATARLHDRPYILVYMIRPDHRLVTVARKAAQKDGLDILLISQFVEHFPGVRTLEAAGVEEFLSAVKYADGVITNSFHGTVFSLLFEKQFLSVRIRTTNARSENLLGLVGLKGRQIDSVKGASILWEGIDYGPVSEKLEGLRGDSIAYLQELVSISQKRSGTSR